MLILIPSTGEPVINQTRKNECSSLSVSFSELHHSTKNSCGNIFGGHLSQPYIRSKAANVFPENHLCRFHSLVHSPSSDRRWAIRACSARIDTVWLLSPLYSADYDEIPPSAPEQQSTPKHSGVALALEDSWGPPPTESNPEEAIPPQQVLLRLEFLNPSDGGKLRNQNFEHWMMSIRALQTTNWIGFFRGSSRKDPRQWFLLQNLPTEVNLARRMKSPCQLLMLHLRRAKIFKMQLKISSL